MNPKNRSSREADALRAKCLALERENLRLHRKIANLEARLVSERNATIARLENTPSKNLTDKELEYIIRKDQESHASPEREARNRSWGITE